MSQTLSVTFSSSHHNEMFSSACSIPDYDSDTVVLTGGWMDDYNSTDLVQRYGLTGLVQYLPSMKEARSYHGCGFYYKDGERVRVQSSTIFLL